MKILHVIDTFNPATGGPPRITLRLAAGAVQLGHAVTILSYDSPASAQEAIREDRKQVPGADQIVYKVLPLPARFERLTALGGRPELKRLLADCDVVHTHDPWSPITRAAMAMAHRRGVPFVLLPNGMFDPWSLTQGRFKKQVLMGLGYRRLLNEALFIHTGNIDEKAGVEQAGITAPIEIIPNGIYPAEFDPLPARGQFYAAHPELNNKPFILFLARLHFKKGLDFLAPAFAKLATAHPDLQLVVAGPDGGAGQAFRQAVETAGLASRVHRVGPIFGQARFTALVDCACFCLPSRQEGFSVAILEAMACGRPVVITENCHFPEVQTSGAGKVVPLDTQAISEALNLVVSNRSNAEQMGAIGRELVLNHYTWSAISAQLVTAYQRNL